MSVKVVTSQSAINMVKEVLQVRPNFVAILYFVQVRDKEGRSVSDMSTYLTASFRSK